MRNYKIEFKWAIIFALMNIVWMLMERVTGLHDEHIDKHAFITNFVAIPAIAIFVFALLDKRKKYYHGVMNYKQGFVTGLIISIMIALLSPLTQYLTFTFITPEYFTNVKTYAVNSGKMTPEAANDYFNFKSYLIQGFVGALAMGIVTSAIVALFTKTSSKKIMV